MKLLELTLCNIFNLLKKDKAVLAFFTFSAFCCILFLVYAYGNLLPSKVVDAINSPYRRTITVRFPERESLSDEKIACLDEFSITNVIVESVTDKYIPFLEINMTLCALRDNGQNGEWQEKDFLFTKEELARNPVIVSIDHSGDAIQFYGVEYPIAHKWNTIDAATAYIPMSEVIKSRIPVDSMSFEFEHFSSMEYLPEIHEKLETQFPNAKVIDPPDAMEAILFENIEVYSFLIAIFGVCVLVLCILENYLLKTCAFSFAVFKTIGANRLHLLTILLLQNALLFTATFLLVAVVHVGVYPAFDTWINIFPNISYNVLDYFGILISLLVLTAIIDFPFAWKFIKETSMALYTDLRR